MSGRGYGGEEGRGSMNNPLKNHDRIKTRWEPKISPAKAAWRNNAARERNVTAATPAASLSAQEVKHLGIIKSHYGVDLYSKTSSTFIFLIQDFETPSCGIY